MSVTRQLFDMPPEIGAMPRDARGYPIPAFVHYYDDGTPDFRIIRRGWREACVNEHKCWLCGGHMGKRNWFVIGPMCGINRVTSEPPSHRLCAEFAVKNCPFLTKPLAKYNEKDLPEDRYRDGIAIPGNPGCCLIWETRRFKPFGAGDGWLIRLGDPDKVAAWREGRPANRGDIEESVKSRVHHLIDLAAAQGPEAIACLEEQVAVFVQVLNKWFPEHRKGGLQ